jgi:hypothetical protein
MYIRNKWFFWNLRNLRNIWFVWNLGNFRFIRNLRDLRVERSCHSRWMDLGDSSS